jgi:hypothetical protein
VKTFRSSAGFLSLVSTAFLMTACFGGPPAPDSCSVEVVGLDELKKGDRGVDVSYRVRGSAGSPATVWLAAQVGREKYIPGGGVSVGPGPFEAIVDLKLTGMPAGFLVILEVAGKRCSDAAPLPNE